MAQEILLVFNNALFKKILTRNNGPFAFVYLGDRNAEISQLLEQKNCREIDLFSCDRETKKQFVNQYLELIGNLDEANQSRFWWVTGISAKNRFISAFFDNLFYFDQLVTIIPHMDELLVIIHPPKEIVPSLVEYCNKHAIRIKIIRESVSSITVQSLKHFINRMKNTIWFVLDIWKRIYISKKYLKKKNSCNLLKNGDYYVLRSWFYDRTISGNNEYHDSFFGILPEYITKKGQKLLIIAGIIGNYSAIVKKIARSDFLIITEESLISSLDPVRVIWEISINKPRFPIPVNLKGNEISKIVSAEIDREFASRQILMDYIHFYSAKNLLDNISVHTFTTIYENNPWEKMYYYTLKKFSPQTKIIGYQHTLISEASINLQLSESEKNIAPLPHNIITIGEITKQFLSRQGNYDINNISVGCALRFESTDTIRLVSRRKNNRILLVMGGIIPRAIEIVNFIYRALNETPQYRVTIRPHPSLPIQSFQNKLGFDFNRRSMFDVSATISVQKDLEESDIVIYDASTLCLEALYIGVPVIHIALKDILSYDPLVGCEHFRWMVGCETDLVTAIKNIYNLTDDEYYRQQEKARQYADQYISRITDEKLREFIP